MDQSGSTKLNLTKQPRFYFQKRDIAHYYGKKLDLFILDGWTLRYRDRDESSWYNKWVILVIIQNQTEFLQMHKDDSFWENIICWDQ